MSKNKFNDFPLRYVLRVTIEAKTPLGIASGEDNVLTDSLVITDVNGLPVIPGTSIAGVLRHLFESSMPNDKDMSRNLFGFQARTKGEGSRIIISNGQFLGKNNFISEGLKNINDTDDFLNRYRSLPIRQHVSINHRGATKEHGKFDQQIVYKGTRFVFEIELKGNKDDKSDWELLKSLLQSNIFRLGGGTRNGFGEIEIIKTEEKLYDLENSSELDEYLAKSSSLKIPLNGELVSSVKTKSPYLNYRLNLSPDDFFMFGSGFGDEDVDMTPVYEEYVEWKDNEPSFSSKKVLIPATSVKGAISHRVAFHYNKLQENWADIISENIKQSDDYKKAEPGKKLEMINSEFSKYVSGNNEAVKELFGFAKDSTENIPGKRGAVIFSDIYLEKEKEKILNHIAIDRFTGGAIDGALFDEKVSSYSTSFSMDILVNKKVIEDNLFKQAFENTLSDITAGMLPLGGGVTKGHGCFNGSWEVINE